MKAIAVIRPGEVRMVELPAAKTAIGPYQALVRTELCCLCNATDGKLVAGHFPGVEKYPLVLGHESVGTIEAVGAKVRNFRVGERAIGALNFEFGASGYHSGWGAFAEYAVVNDHLAMVEDCVADAGHGWAEVFEIQTTVSDDIPLEAAVLLCTWREVLGGIGDFHIEPGQHVLIYGAGPVGLSFVRFCSLLGVNYIGIVDPHAWKRERALALGATEAFEPGNAKLDNFVQHHGRLLDAVIDAVGMESIVNAALPLIKLGGSVCVYGVLAQPALNLHKARGPYNFNLLVHQWPTRWRERAAQEQLCAWIREGLLRAQDFITHDLPCEEIQQALERARSGQSLKILMRFQNAS
ncbi:MAG: zinc-binding dehydrogenase [Terracidiphilus sp.]|nr:zinc-binding dehydrogenase [Terracidiphilus sp.]